MQPAKSYWANLVR